MGIKWDRMGNAFIRNTNGNRLQLLIRLNLKVWREVIIELQLRDKRDLHETTPMILDEVEAEIQVPRSKQMWNKDKYRPCGQTS